MLQLSLAEVTKSVSLTFTYLWFGDHRVNPALGTNVMTGAVTSVSVIVAVAELFPVSLDRSLLAVALAVLETPPQFAGVVGLVT